MPDFVNHPGWLYVVATLLPLVSFFLIILAGTVWGIVRPYQKSWGAGLYRLLGGETGGRVPAYVALGAIVLSFLCCLYGFVTYYTDHHHHEEEVGRVESRIAGLHHQLENENADQAALHAELEKANEELHEHEEHWNHRWSGHVDWLRVSPAGLNDDQQATVLQVGYRIDGLAAAMFLMVSLVASLIHLFSIGYMSEELSDEVVDHQVHTAHGHYHRRGRFGRFFMFLSLFCFSMFNLMLADNLFQVFVSWELVGICSFLLIGFYFERKSASNAANKAFIVNRVGDAGFIIGLLIVWTYFGSFNFEQIFSRVRAPMHDSNTQVALGQRIVKVNPAGDAEEGQGGQKMEVVESGGSHALIFPRQPDHHDFEGPVLGEAVTTVENPDPTQYGTIPYWMLVVAGLGIFLGCVGKSAQFPLHVWLPDAMEGPTPVSALIHAATMVAAGVYLVGRCYPLFTFEVLMVIAYIGAITLFVAATIAIVMTDIKKVLAYSTVSQLGYMMLALGVGGWIAGLFHLLTHAFFKALLFLGSGSVIYGCHHEQEMTKMGGLYPKMKITALTMFVGVLAIAGIPLFSGWYSKDAILAQAMGFWDVHPEHVLLFVLPLITAGITTFYMFRMWFMTFMGQPRDRHVYEHAHESPWTMTIPLVVLAFFSVVVAWGWPVWDAEASALEKHLHHAQPASVVADFGGTRAEYGTTWTDEQKIAVSLNTREKAHELHHSAGGLALGVVAIGLLFAMLLYYYRTLDPAEAKEQAPRVHAFLSRKWYFDELYSVMIVRPAMVIAHYCKAFDLRLIDGFVHLLAGATVWTSRWDGRFDNGIIDGLVRLTSRVTYAVGAWFRSFQTGFIRSYVLFLALAAVVIFVVLSYFGVASRPG